MFGYQTFADELRLLPLPPLPGPRDQVITTVLAGRGMLRAQVKIGKGKPPKPKPPRRR